MDWHNACRQTADLARSAINWVNDPQNQKTVGLERKAVDRRLRTLVTELTKLDRSLDRPMSVSVFGASQAGKSYFSSLISQPRDGRPFMVRFAGQEDTDYKDKINPPGGGESTGVVTRFSIRSVDSPPGFPVCVRLLSEIEVVKMLGNSYFLDSDPKVMPQLQPEQTAALLAELRSRAGSEVPSDNRLTAEDIWDLQDYFDSTFEGMRHLEALKGLWDEAVTLAPRLNIEDRGRLFELIWWGVPQFTEMYRELTGCLAKLGFPADAFCTMDALVPRDESIIDALALKVGMELDDKPLLNIRSFHGNPVELPRAFVTALIAELHITMSEMPWPIFEHTDLLDFPGARTRKRDNLVENFKDPTKRQRGESILRGKVAYLFERYVAEQELTSMILCIGDSNQEVSDLPEMIANWVGVSHGASAAERVGKSVVLFLVLTKFDRTFEGKSARDDFGEQFKMRLESSIKEFVARREWVDNWTPGETFRNCFWLRDPKYGIELLIRRDDGREIELLPTKDQALKQYLKVPAVQRYFQDPERAFEEVLRFNDGGITYLVEKLTPNCEPGLKDRQIRGRLDALRNEMDTLLAQFHVDNDVEKRLKERRAVSGRILAHVQHLAGQKRFADLVGTLQITEETASRVLYEAQARRSRGVGAADSGDRKPAAAPALPGLLLGTRPLPGARPLPGQQPAAASAAPRPAIRSGSLEMYLARSVVEAWIGALYTAAENDILQRFFVGEPKLALELVNEISAAAGRSRLDERLGEAIAGLAGSVDEGTDAFLEKAGFASCAVMNHFVNELDYGEVPVAERPQAPGPDEQMRPIFLPRRGADSALQLAVAPSSHHDDLLYDWMYALHDTIESNAKSVDGLSLNIEQNAAIGRILDGLRSALGA